MLTTEITTAPCDAMKTKRGLDPLTELWPEQNPVMLSRVSAASEEASVRVTAVIPTRGRPVLAERAVRSALAQDFPDFEIVVVIDGPDPETSEAMRLIKDDRLRVVELKENAGGSEARNIGVRFARGNWVAFLDDDDEWLPGKLEQQWALGGSMTGGYAIVASHFIERTDSAERVLPRRVPGPQEAFSEYLFARQGWQSGEGFLQTSTWFVTRALMLKVPFTRGLKRCQDLDWLLHATALPGVEVQVVPKVLAIFHHDESRVRVSRSADWRFLYSWALSNKRYFTRRAFSFFLATFCVPSAAKEQEGWACFFFLLRSCVVHGDPSLKCLVLFLTFWWMTEDQRRGLRVRYHAIREASLKRLAGFLRQQVPRKVTQ